MFRKLSKFEGSKSYIKNNPLNKRLFLLSGRRDSNPESLGPKPSALAVTLRPDDLISNF